MVEVAGGRAEAPEGGIGCAHQPGPREEHRRAESLQAEWTHARRGYYVGDIIEKDITLDAAVKLPDGQTVRKNLVVTASRTIMKDQKGETLTGRWIITKVREAQAPKTS